MDALVYTLLGVVLSLAAAVLIQRRWSFRAQRSEDYAGAGPEFDLTQHLAGPLLCEGVLYGPTGRVRARFVADMRGSWLNGTGTLTEEFRYDSGATQSRSWTLKLDDSGRIRAEAPDLVGPGEGRQSGPTVRLNYRIRLPEASGGHVLDVTDWMYLLENGAIINRSEFRKFGIPVAELVATLRPAPAAQMGQVAAE